ncbi:energy transducer TonB [Psychroserpens sp. XS_ASV72]|uniref:energy transducer TonB n=1 Tax=Psychroserpens sp. XS_ASV72 TaxID=3241293 RepID=UPI003518A189
MKPFVFVLLLFLNGLFLFSQEKILSQSELDSLNDIENTDRIEFFKTNMLSRSVSMNGVVPIYEGCKKEKSNHDKKDCMSLKIMELFQKNFKTEMHEESDLEPGKKRIHLIFKIGTDGLISNIVARAEDQYLEAEAIRVAKLMPKLTPAMLDGKSVEVPYAVPILVDIIPNSNEGLTRYPIFRGCSEKLSNEELEECSRRKIMNFIKMSFDIEMANVVMPKARTTQFLLEFTINKKGKIENINAKANHKAIAIEAIKIAKRLPKFKEPGIWEGVAVDTPFSLLMTIYLY